LTTGICCSFFPRFFLYPDTAFFSARLLHKARHLDGRSVVFTRLKRFSLRTDTMTAGSATAAQPRVSWVARIAPWLVTVVFILLVVRLASFIDRYTVNIVYWDQWDFLQGLFESADPWTLFRWQHGPQRQGLGNLATAILYSATDWNGRADAAASGFAMVLACLAALWLVKRLCGALVLWDAVLPLLFLTTSSAETYVVAPNLAHGPLPVLLVVTYALALTIRAHPSRCLAMVALNFFAVNTGFTLLLGGITPAILLLLACSPRLTGRERAIYAGGVAASIATVALFLYGFSLLSATDCFQFPHTRPWEYVPYAGLVLSRPFGVEAAGHLFIGSLVATGMAGFVGYAMFQLIRAGRDSIFWLVTSCLAGFTLLFAGSTAVGRVCLGFDSAMATRYIPYILPGLFAVYLVIRRASRRSSIATALLPVFVVACIAKERDMTSINEAGTYLLYKQRWRDCYLSTHDIDECDAVAGHGVYPAPEATKLQEKLDWLEARGLSLFRRDSQ
jgi:hypothetical protein